MKKSFAMSLTMGTGIAIFFTVFGLLFLQPILNILNVPSGSDGNGKKLYFRDHCQGLWRHFSMMPARLHSVTRRYRDATCDPGNLGSCNSEYCWGSAFVVVLKSGVRELRSQRYWHRQSRLLCAWL